MTNTTVWICPVEPSQPFVCEVHGPITGSAIEEIENDLREDPSPFDECPPCVVGVECVLEYDPGETQYGSGYGDVLVIPGYFLLTPTGHIRVIAGHL